MPHGKGIGSGVRRIAKQASVRKGAIGVKVRSVAKAQRRGKRKKR